MSRILKKGLLLLTPSTLVRASNVELRVIANKCFREGVVGTGQFIILFVDLSLR